jgi:hypothetical protein
VEESMLLKDVFAALVQRVDAGTEDVSLVCE